ncbi:hypothetical protein [Robertkochia flava]|uniref:hypothetical protein n=1 Tax=Robertkochia flava TaxID=3447986 RepID=UPI001CCCC130|nr:hypothetical protein [Robertkochia marina]
MKTHTLALGITLLIWCCKTPLPEHLELLTYLPKSMEENSGMETIPGSPLVWFINDSGNKDHLYGINLQGKIEKDFNIKGASNEDWEDLAADEQGNIYIADIGNNNFKRDQLYIYKLPNPATISGDNIEAEEIEITYPGHDKNQPFNAEALLYYKDRLYIFTKNVKKDQGPATRLFSVPASPGKHEATLMGDITTCKNQETCEITAADISPDGKVLLLLGYDSLWIAPNFLEQDSIPPFRRIALQHRTQKEAVCFFDNQTLFISDERNSTGGGILYRYISDQLKAEVE